VGVDVPAESFVAAWLAPGGQPGAPFTGEQTPATITALAVVLLARRAEANAPHNSD
jgi:hypothetical protein